MYPVQDKKLQHKGTYGRKIIFHEQFGKTTFNSKNSNLKDYTDSIIM
jgi:hypothetical protein